MRAALPWLAGILLFLTFFFGMGVLSLASNTQRNQQEIECIKAGGTMETMPMRVCVKK